MAPQRESGFNIGNSSSALRLDTKKLGLTSFLPETKSYILMPIQKYGTCHHLKGEDREGERGGERERGEGRERIERGEGREGKT